MKQGLSSLLRGPRASRFRLAVVLLLMFTTILAGKFWEDAYVENLRRDCGSLFEDRLMPATMLYRLGDQVHNKREELEEYLHGDESPDTPSLEYRIGKHDAAIESLIDDIEHTYLVDEESRLLSELRQAVSDYDKKERALLERHRAGEKVRYGREMRAAFSRVRDELTALTEVQEEVGKKLNKDSVASAAHVTSLLYFQLGITFVLGLLASGLAMSLEGQSVQPRPEAGDPKLH